MLHDRRCCGAVMTLPVRFDRRVAQPKIIAVLGAGSRRDRGAEKDQEQQDELGQGPFPSGLCTSTLLRSMIDLKHAPA